MSCEKCGIAWLWHECTDAECASPLQPSASTESGRSEGEGLSQGTGEVEALKRYLSNLADKWEMQAVMFPAERETLESCAAAIRIIEKRDDSRSSGVDEPEPPAPDKETLDAIRACLKATATPPEPPESVPVEKLKELADRMAGKSIAYRVDLRHDAANDFAECATILRRLLPTTD